MDDFVLNVRQIWQYPLKTIPVASDLLLLQEGPSAGAYKSATAAAVLSSALAAGGFIQLSPNGGIKFNGATLGFSAGMFWFSTGAKFMGAVNVPSLNSAGAILINGQPVAIQADVDTLLDNIVTSFNGRSGAVQLDTDDVLRAGGAPISNAHFGGFNTSPTPWDFRANDDQIATTAFVQLVINQLICGGSIVSSFNGRAGNVVLTADDITAAATVSGAMPQTNTPPEGDASKRIANTAFVDAGLQDLQSWAQAHFDELPPLDIFAPINSPNFTGVPTAPTASNGTSTGQLATTAFVQNAVTASTTGVATFNGRTGAVVLTITDITGASGAPIAGPAFTGVPTAPNATLHNSSTQLATTAYVQAELAAFVPPVSGVTSFNTRTGAVTLDTADVTGAGGAPTASPALTGTPTAPTAAAATNTTQIATTAFVTAAVTAAGGVATFNGRTGAVNLIANDVSAAGGALLASPAFTGNPTAPTPPAADNDTSIATTAFVQAVLTGLNFGVTSFNTRQGAVVLAGGDITSAGGALLASPNFSGAPTAPTAAQSSNDTTLATTAYVRAALAAAPGGVSSWNSRTGNVTLQANDISSVGGALLASPALSGTPTAPTVTPASDSTLKIATTAFVHSALAAVAGGATISPTPPATPFQGQLWWESDSGALFISYNDGSSTQWVGAAGGGTAAPPTRTVLTAGTGTYTTPTGATWIEVELVGGGAGGQADVTNTAGGAGGNTTFGPLTGFGAAAAGGNSAPGGTASGGDVNIKGGDGSNSANLGNPATNAMVSGNDGGASFFGGAGAGKYGGNPTTPAGTNGAPNSGSGGGGGGRSDAGNIGGAGGGAGGYCRKLIANPSATYPYVVGAGGVGAAGAGTAFAGGNGGSGIIIVTEHYGA